MLDAVYTQSKRQPLPQELTSEMDMTQDRPRVGGEREEVSDCVSQAIVTRCPFKGQGLANPV